MAGHDAGQHLAQVSGGHHQIAPHAAVVAGGNVFQGAEVGHAQPAAAAGQLFPPQILELEVNVAFLEVGVQQVKRVEKLKSQR